MVNVADRETTQTKKSHVDSFLRHALLLRKEDELFIFTLVITYACTKAKSRKFFKA